MFKRYQEKVCVFCDPLDPINVVLHVRDGWRDWDNPFLKKQELAFHRVMAPIEHLVGATIGLTIKDFEAMGGLFLTAQRERQDIFGETRDRWEIHIIDPDLSGNVRFILNPTQLPQAFAGITVAEGITFGGWRQVKNEQAMPHTRTHLLFRPHSDEPFSLNTEDFTDLGEIFLQAVSKHKLPGGGVILTNAKRTIAFAMRFGPIQHNEGSVLHQHGNVYVTHPTVPFDIPLGKDPKKTAEGWNRMLAFEALRTGTKLEDLPADQLETVTDRPDRLK